MKRPPHAFAQLLRMGRLPAIAAILVLLGVPVAAQAYLSSTGGSSASASVGILPAPRITSVTAAAGAVELAWTAVTAPGSPAVEYYLTRDGGASSGNCPTSTSPAAAVTSCTDRGLSAGRQEYTVTAVWRSWTASSQAKAVELASGAATHLVLEASTSTPTAGVGDDLTITAKDSSNNTVTTYAGSKSLTFGGASAVGLYTPSATNSSGTTTKFGSPTAINFTNGVAKVTASTKNGWMRLYKAEAAKITVTDGSISNGAGLSVEVEATVATRLSMFAESTTPSAGAADDLTITALDEFGNTATSYTGPKSLRFTGASTIGSFTPTVTDSSGAAVPFGSPTAINFVNGMASVAESTNNGVITLYKAETAKITLTDGTISNGAGLSLTIKAAPVASIALSAAKTELAAGEADNLTITALDAYGNGLTGLQNLTFTGANTIGSFTPTVTNSSGVAVRFGSPTAITFANGVAQVTASPKNGVMRLYRAETATITVTDGSISNGAGLSVEVKVAAAKRLSLSAESTTPSAGAADDLTITALDEFGNTATSYTGPKSLRFTGASTIGSFTPTVTDSSGAAVPFGSPTAINFMNGVASVAESTNNGVMTLYKAETAKITLTDGTISNGAGLSLTVKAAAQHALEYVTTKGGATNACPTGKVENVGQNGSMIVFVAVLDSFGNLTVNGSAALTVNVTRASGDGEQPRPSVLTVNEDASPAVTFDSSLLKVKSEVTTYTASSGSLASVSCAVEPS